MSSQKMGAPHVIEGTGPSLKAQPVKRMPLDARGSKIDEGWLQEIIHHAPQVLPVGSIFSRARGRIVSIGREISVAAGFIDNLLVTASGHVVVVETKLWRNPQARREVVAQILDYASYVKNWDYKKLDVLWREAGGKRSLYEAVAPEEDEASWVDLVNEQLDAGEMVLLIVGDGIESRAEALAETVGGRPDMNFRLALVELQLHVLEDGRTLVIPNTLAKTAEIERATVRVVYAGETRPQVTVDVPLPDSTGRKQSGSRTTLDAQALMAEIETSGPEGPKAAKVVRELLRQLDERSGELVVEWKSAGFAVKTPDPVAEGSMLSLAVVNRPNALYSFCGWIKEQINRNWESPTIAQELALKLGERMEALGGRVTHGGLQVSLSLTEISGREKEVIDTLSAMVEVIRREAQKQRQ